MTDVFISYSRRNEQFVEQLREALTESGKDVWVDREDIGPAVEWRREIELGIEGSDIFAFVITPEALASEHCSRERAYALAKKKRIVPLLRRDPNSQTVPEELASRNYIFFRTDDEFGPGCTSLLAAIENLPEWAREHTRLLERAEEWDHRSRDGSFLLRGSDLREAERWLGEQAAHKEPQPTPIQIEMSWPAARQRRVASASRLRPCSWRLRSPSPWRSWPCSSATKRSSNETRPCARHGWHSRGLLLPRPSHSFRSIPS